MALFGFVMMKIVFPLFLFYVLNATVFLLVARLEKDEDGNLVLDANSWHFKVAYPFARESSLFQGRMRIYGISICPYFAKLFVMVYLVWPFLILFQFLKFLIYTPFCLVFGYLVVPWDIEGIRCAALYDHNSFEQKIWKIPVPEIKGVRTTPAFIVLPAFYFWLWAWVSGIMFVIHALIIVMATTVLVCYWFENKDSEKSGLVREWASAKKESMCRIAKVKNL